VFTYEILEADSLINKQQLDELAKKNWRLITIVQHEGKFFFYFEVAARPN